jgi:hypothetical protein
VLTHSLREAVCRISPLIGWADNPLSDAAVSMSGRAITGTAGATGLVVTGVTGGAGVGSGGAPQPLSISPIDMPIRTLKSRRKTD